jgi:pseudaminic acid synthase
MSEIAIAGRRIGPGHPPYVIAELSGNHNGDFDRAMRLMEAAAAAGADAVKLQTYTADTITIDHDGPGFRMEGGLWHGRTLYELYQEAHTPWDWQPALFARGRELGVAVFSSPFDPTAVDFLAGLDAPAYKIASFECIDLPLIAHAARQGKPLIISTGMADLAEIAEATATARHAGADGLVLLHCVSGYPTPASDCNLRTIPDLARRFPDAVIGLSDHTLGTTVAAAAVALGAAVIEKHVTLARADGGPDAAFSLEPHELARLVEEVRTAWEALGEAGYSLKGSEAGNAGIRRSLYAVRDIAAGETLTPENVRSIRPGGGLAPKHYPAVLGRRSTRAIPFGTPLSWDMIE